MAGSLASERQVVTVALAALLLWLRRVRLAVFVVVANGGSSLLNTFVKAATNRSRPVVNHPAPPSRSPRGDPTDRAFDGPRARLGLGHGFRTLGSDCDPVLRRCARLCGLGPCAQVRLGSPSQGGPGGGVLAVLSVMWVYAWNPSSR